MAGRADLQFRRLDHASEPDSRRFRAAVRGAARRVVIAAGSVLAAHRRHHLGTALAGAADAGSHAVRDSGSDADGALAAPRRARRGSAIEARRRSDAEANRPCQARRHAGRPIEALRACKCRQGWCARRRLGQRRASAAPLTTSARRSHSPSGSSNGIPASVPSAPGGPRQRPVAHRLRPAARPWPALRRCRARRSRASDPHR